MLVPTLKWAAKRSIVHPSDQRSFASSAESNKILSLFHLTGYVRVVVRGCLTKIGGAPPNKLPNFPASIVALIGHFRSVYLHTLWSAPLRDASLAEEIGKFLILLDADGFLNDDSVPVVVGSYYGMSEANPKGGGR